MGYKGGTSALRFLRLEVFTSLAFVAGTGYAYIYVCV